jgi:nucleoside-diphosphate-sugar epimerase
LSHRVLLATGATSTVGSAVLERLLGSAAFTSATIVVRTVPLAPPPGVEVVSGDVTRKDLGIEPVRASALAREVTDILHMAADTRFGAPLDALRAVNVAGAEHTLAFANRCPKLARLLTFSTVYVAGRRSGTVYEHDAEHEAGFVNEYERSKYEGEERFRGAMASMPVAIARLSTIVGRAADGVVSRPGAIHHALRFYYQSLAPMLPGTPSSPVDLIPLEYAADAGAAMLVRAYVPGATWHIAAGHDAPSLESLLTLTRDCFLRFRPAWRRRAIEKPTIVSLRTFDRFADSVEELQSSVLSRCVASIRPFAPQLAYPKVFDDRNARSALESCGIARPAFDTYYPSVVKHLIETHWSRADEATAS